MSHIPYLSTVNSYTMVWPPVCGDNPQALASGLSPVEMENHGINQYTTYTFNILY